MPSDPRRNFRIASGGGRMTITMDRYGADWPMVARGYRCHTHGVGRPFASAAEAVADDVRRGRRRRRRTPETSTSPSSSSVDAGGQPVGTIADGDAVVLFNFRGDRAIEISRAYEEADFAEFDRSGPAGRPRPACSSPGCCSTTATRWCPSATWSTRPRSIAPISEYLCAEGVRSFAVSETQKFGHVTYFWNGNRSGYINAELETYVEIQSDNVAFDTTPAMKVREITDEVIDLLRTGEYRFGRLNFPSGDMVGHTGNLDGHGRGDGRHRRVDATTGRRDPRARRGARLHRRPRQRRRDVHRGRTACVRRRRRTPSTRCRSRSTTPTTTASTTWPMLAGAGLANVAATLLNLLGFDPPPTTYPACSRSRTITPTSYCSRMASKSTKLDHLKQISLFEGCSTKELQAIAKAGDEITMTAGTIVVDQGQMGREAFVLLDGQVSVKRNGRKITSLGTGAVVGELSLLDHGPRTATVVCDTDCTLFVIDASPLPRRARAQPVDCDQAARHAGRPHPQLRPPVLRLNGCLTVKFAAVMSAHPESAANPGEPKRIKPHHLAIGLGVGIAVFTAVSGIVPRYHRVAQRQRDPSRGVRRHPRAAQGGVLHRHPADADLGLVPVRQPHEELGARRPGPTPHHRQERQEAGRVASAPASTCRPCCATRPPG